jgi:RimJ/RimL family protein N-acetyltransferase
MNKVAFETPRLSAIFIDDSNQNLVFDLYSRKENIEFLEGISAENDVRLSRECYGSYHDLGAYLIFEKQNKKFVGIGGIQKQEPMLDGSFAMSHEVEFLIVMHHKFCGFGYASEFCRIFFQKLFAAFPQIQVPARVQKENLSCLKLLKKFGFKEIGEIDYHKYGNKFALLKSDFASFKKTQNEKRNIGFTPFADKLR